MNCCFSVSIPNRKPPLSIRKEGAIEVGVRGDQPGDGSEKIRDLKSGRLTMLALLPVARMTSRPLR